jgi:hypothetical protein
MPLTPTAENPARNTETEDEKFMKRIFTLLCGLMLSLLAGSIAASADVVLEWNVIAVNTAVANKANPFAQARYAAIVQLAVFEAVNSITHKYHPYLGTITAPAGAAPDAAAVEAAYQVLSTYFPASQATLYAAYLNSMADIPDGQSKLDGIAVGDAAAAAMIALRSNDGSSPPEFGIPGPPIPGVREATPSCPVVNGIASGISYQWQNVTPFGISSVSDFLLEPPPSLTSRAYTKAYNEVMTVGSVNSTQRPPDRANVALFYAASRDDGISITLTNPAVPTITLHYTSFGQITADISDARVFGGIHFRTDQDAGAKLGKAVGKAVYKKNLRRVEEETNAPFVSSSPIVAVKHEWRSLGL